MFKSIGCIAFVALLPALSATAAPLIEPMDWSGSEGWTSVYNNATVTDPQAVGGNPGGYLDINFPSDPDVGNPNEFWDVFQAPATNLFAGSYSNQIGFEFDFWSDTVAPSVLQVRFGGQSGNEWGYTVDPGSTQSWNRLLAPFDSYADWLIEPFLTQDDFFADLENIEWIGIYILRGPGSDSQVFGIDNFTLTIPEPAQLLMLAAAMASTFISRRRRRSPGPDPPV